MSIANQQAQRRPPHLQQQNLQEQQQQLASSSATGDRQAVILASPYQLAGRSALFRGRYGDRIGFSVLPHQPSGVVVGMSASVIYRAIESLGFLRIDESGAGATIAASKQKLSFLITSAGLPLLHGPNYLAIKPYVSRMYQICSKWHLVHSLRQAEERMRQRGQSYLTGSGGAFCFEQFTPFTINMGSVDLEETLVQNPGMYLAKPVGGSMGERLQLVRIRRECVRTDLLAFLTSSEFQNLLSAQVILQRYIERPLLVDKRKFDMRVYMLVVNAKRCPDDCIGADDTVPQIGYFVFMHPGFVRLCSSPYELSNADLAVHLTNQSIQAKMTNTFGQLKEVTTWYPDELNDYLNKRRRLPVQNWTRDVMYPKIGAILGYISAVFRFYLDDRDCPSNTFRILGVDFLVDEQLRVYLLEFNAYPAWGCQTSVLSDLKPNLWREAVCLSSEVVVRYQARLPVSEQHLATKQNFSLVFNSDEPDLARQNVARMYDKG